MARRDSQWCGPWGGKRPRSKRPGCQYDHPSSHAKRQHSRVRVTSQWPWRVGRRGDSTRRPITADKLRAPAGLRASSLTHIRIHERPAWAWSDAGTPSTRGQTKATYVT